MKNIFLLLFCLIVNQIFSQENLPYQRPPEEIAKLVEAPPAPLLRISPDKTTMILLERSEFPSIEELSRPELRLAGLRINPDNYGPSRANYFVGITIRKLEGEVEIPANGLPSPLLISHLKYSPDSRKVAFLQNNPDGIELWWMDLKSGNAKKVTERRINAVVGNGFEWFSDSENLIFTAVPGNVEKPGDPGRVPTGPVIEENLGRKAPARTYQDLLKNNDDEVNFKHYASSELYIGSLRGEEKLIAQTAIHRDFSPSPDGKLIITETIHEPFSYLVPYYRFPTLVKVIDRNGKDVKILEEMPLFDNIPTAFNAVQPGPRYHSWRADKPATVVWVTAQDGGDPKKESLIRDKVFTWSYPFDRNPESIISLTLRFSGIDWGTNEIAWVNEYWWNTRQTRTFQVNPTHPMEPKLVFDRNFEDVYNDPGDVVTKYNEFGRQVMIINSDNSVYLTGNGASAEGDIPFIDKMDLHSKKKERLWHSEAPYYERFGGFINEKEGEFVVLRESNEENPNFFIRKIGGEELKQLTHFPHPYPHLKGVKKQVLKYKRGDGLDLTADLYLPPDYKPEDGKLPGIVWAYPREFKSADAAGQVKGSPYAFTRLYWGSPVYWVTRGYAVLDNASLPIVGEGDQEPNDTYIEQLVAGAMAIANYADSLGIADKNRLAIGGHSYGAFMTANLLAHSEIFKAGIARSGAYNRTLTPFGFQAEERTYWEAPEVYFKMSPFSFANKINEPILIIHGEADNNSGTFPMQSERMYNAIKGHGGIARYVVLPYESHGYRAKESILHMLWEQDQWLEKYVKNPEENK